jgi:hypothetical protein
MLTQAPTARRAQLFRTAVFSCAHPGTALGARGTFLTYRAGQSGLVTYRAGQPGLVTYRAGRPGLVTYRAGQPGLIQLTGDSDGLAEADASRSPSAARTLPGGVWQMAPGHGMTAKSCCNCRPRPAVAAARDTRVRGPDQAAFARRILRRRSEARSSSLRPPQVPYFSGRDTA